VAQRAPHISAIPTPPLVKDIDWKDQEVHHIFAQQTLRDRYSRTLPFDETANVTLISSKANEWIADRDPSDYELRRNDPMLLIKHFVPSDENLWKVENYELFLAERPKLIIQSLQEI
jgi:hypothetical protein